MKIKLKYHITFCLLSALIVFSFYFTIDAMNCGDFTFHYNRIQGITDAINHGNLKQWIYFGDYTYGYQTPVYYSDILLIPFGLLTLFGLQNITIMQIVIFVIHLISFYTSFWMFNSKYENKNDAFLYAIAYGLSFFTLNRLLYCALGRMMVYAFIPIMLKGLDNIFDVKKKWYTLSIGVALICYSNSVMSLIVALFILIYMLIKLRQIIHNKLIQIRILKAGILTFMLSSLAILPFIEGVLSEKNASFLSNTTLIGKEQYTLTRILKDYIPQISIISEIFDNELYTIVASILFTCIMLIYYKFSKNEYKKYLVISLSILFISTEMFPWKIIHNIFPYLLKLELPFRMSIFTESYLFIYMVKNKKDWKPIILAITCAMIGFLIFKPFDSQFIKSNDELIYKLTTEPSTEASITYGATFDYVPENYVETLIYNMIDDGETITDIQNELYSHFNNIKNNPVQIDGVKIERLNATDFIVQYENLDKVEIPLFFYNGYKITDIGKGLQYTQSDNGFILVNPIFESGTLRVEHVWTPIQILSAIITALSIFYILGAELGSYKKRKSAFE